MPAQCRQRLRIPCLAWALLISALIHLLLVLLVAQPTRRVSSDSNGTFVFHARMEPAPVAARPLEIAPPPATETPAAAPAPPPASPPLLDAPAAIQVERYYEVHELDAVPVPKQDIVPQYPAEALAARMTGMVQLEMYVDETGAIESVRVMRSTAPGVFDQAALDAFQHQAFVPGIKDGKPVRTRLKLVVNFGDHPGGDMQ